MAQKGVLPHVGGRRTGGEVYSLQPGKKKQVGGHRGKKKTTLKVAQTSKCRKKLGPKEE